MTSRIEPGAALLTAEELRRRASALVPVLKERAARTEELRQIPGETVSDLLSSELYLVGVPKRFGGVDADYGLVLEVAAELGRACPSTAWCYGLWRPTPGWSATGPCWPRTRSSPRTTAPYAPAH